MRATIEPPPDEPPVAPAPPVGRTAARWADLKVRVLSAAVLAPVALVCMWIGGSAFGILVALIAVGLSYEWLGLCGQRQALAAWLLFAALPVSVALTELDAPGAALLVLAAATATLAIRGRGRSGAWELAFGVPYLGLGAVTLVWLRQLPASGGANVIVLLSIISASDIGAYVTGRAIGGPRLAPVISPGKTWSGAAGGLLAAAAVGLAASAIQGDGRPSGRAVAFAAMTGLIGQAGDLFESGLKRHFGVKDTGSIIPGHGGLLDRLDAVLTAAPAVALLALILGRGVVLWE